MSDMKPTEPQRRFAIPCDVVVVASGAVTRKAIEGEKFLSSVTKRTRGLESHFLDQAHKLRGERLSLLHMDAKDYAEMVTTSLRNIYGPKGGRQ